MLSMRLIDDSPGFFLTLCFVVLYSTVAVESVMLAAGGIVFMLLVFVGVLVIAAALCAWMFRLLDDGAQPVEAVREPAVVAAPAPEPAATQPTTPQPTAPQPTRVLTLT
jgi:hypothetical protein